jgi:hypothetical protein
MPKIDDIVVGTCGNCGGPVCIPRVWMSVIKPIPTCERCGSQPQDSFGPTLPMKPAPVRRDYSKF